VKPRILCVSFSPISADARVLRQIEVLSEHGEVTTVGYGEAPASATRHIRVPDAAASLPQTLSGVARLAFHRHDAVELTAPGERAVRHEVIAAGPYDLVVANDARALPLAFAAADDAPVWADMHEWAPQERAANVVWRVLVGPYMQHLCEKYLPRAAAVTTVSSGLADLYNEHFGVRTELVRNATELRDLKPSPVAADRIRLVHSGTADPQRNIVELIEAVGRLDGRYSLDLYLIEVPGGHLKTIRRLAEATNHVTVHDPVAPETLPSVLNQYDLGVFLFPLRTLSKLHHLPNKFFDFVQARLGLVFSPAPEIEAYFTTYGVGVLTPGTTADDLVETLRHLTSDDVAALKDASDASAAALSSDADRATQSAIINRLVGIG
jgi:glycosyltransferase involved in cell wall biosynthesis